MSLNSFTRACGYVSLLLGCVRFVMGESAFEPLVLGWLLLIRADIKDQVSKP